MEKKDKIALAIALTAAVSVYSLYKVNQSQNVQDDMDVEPATNLEELLTTETESNSEENSDSSYETCKSQSLPSFVNVSLTWSGQIYGDALRSLSPPSVIVVAAGNDHPQPISLEKVQASQNFDAIVVGSLDPTGQKSSYSSEHEEVHIMAPSGSYLTSADGNGQYKRFGGTSGSTPLVTGSLAGFEWLSSYHPTAEEAKILLEKTAIPTQYSNDNPQKNGVGMVNAYKLGMVGKKLKEACGEDIDCFKRMIQQDSTYEFPEDQNLETAVTTAFPECSDNQCTGEYSVCLDKGSVFKRLRKEAFLNPSNKKLWSYIGCIYNSSEFGKDARGATSIYKALSGFSSTNQKTYSSCSMNEDCTLVPACGNGITNSGFSAVNLDMTEIYRIEQCGQSSLCNQECSCDSQEEVASDTSTTTYSGVCSNFQCVVNSETVQSQDVSPQSSDGLK